MDDMLDRLAAAFRGHDGGPMSPELLRSIDAALAEAITGSGDSVREDALIGLVGIRRGLFPDAPAYQPEAPGPAGFRSVAA